MSTYLIGSIVQKLPGWFPGTGFKRIAAQWNSTLTQTIEGPAQFVKAKMRENSHTPSFLSDLYEHADGELTKEDEFSANWSAGSLYTGGAETASIYLLHLCRDLY